MINEIIIGMLGLAATMVMSIASLAYWLGRRFTQIDAQFANINERFKQIDERFTQIDERFKHIDERFTQIDAQFANINERFKQIDERFKRVEEMIDYKIRQVEGHLKEMGENINARIGHIEDRLREIEVNVNARINQVEGRLKEMDEDINARINQVEGRLNVVVKGINSVVESTRNQMEFFAEFLGFRKVLDARDVTFVKNELIRLSVTPLMNPLTREEFQRMKELIEKEKLSLQEADELREIARKLVREYGGTVPEVWKLLIYASIMRGIALSELEEEKKE
ncbi:MAG: hypothetical protein ACP5IZ_08955 [Thermoprotei archaeon]